MAPAIIIESLELQELVFALSWAEAEASKKVTKNVAWPRLRNYSFGLAWILNSIRDPMCNCATLEDKLKLSCKTSRHSCRACIVSPASWLSFLGWGARVDVAGVGKTHWLGLGRPAVVSPSPSASFGSGRGRRSFSSSFCLAFNGVWETGWCLGAFNGVWETGWLVPDNLASAWIAN